MSKRTFLFLVFLIFLLSLFLRVWHLSLRPLHHDEGVAWYFFIQKISQGEPVDFYFEQHGLLPFFLSSLPYKLFGPSISSLRLAPAVFGALSSLLFLFLRKEFGAFACLVSSFLLAISPIETYYSRYLISYPYFVFFFLLFLIALLKYLKNFQKIYLFLVLFFLTCLFLTNEAIFIYLGALFLSLFLILVFFKQTRTKFTLFFKRTNFSFFLLSFFLVFLFFVFIQTSLFKNWLNLFKLQLLPSLLLKKSLNTGHNKPFFYYLKTIALLCPSLLFLYFLSLLLFLKKTIKERKKEILPAFFLFFSLINFFIFSLIKYKTPWVLTIIVLPLIIFIGLNLSAFFFQPKKSLKKIAFLFGFFCLSGYSLFSCQKTNFKLFAAPRAKNPLSYVQTTEEINNLQKDVYLYFEKKKSKGKILVVAKSYWPIPFYLRDFSLFYLAKPESLSLPSVKDYDVIIADNDQKFDFSLELFEKKNYFLREGVNLLVLFKKTNF